MKCKFVPCDKSSVLLSSIINHSVIVLLIFLNCDTSHKSRKEPYEATLRYTVRTSLHFREEIKIGQGSVNAECWMHTVDSHLRYVYETFAIQPSQEKWSTHSGALDSAFLAATRLACFGCMAAKRAKEGLCKVKKRCPTVLKVSNYFSLILH